MPILKESWYIAAMLVSCDIYWDKPERKSWGLWLVGVGGSVLLSLNTRTRERSLNSAPETPNPTWWEDNLLLPLNPKNPKVHSILNKRKHPRGTKIHPSLAVTHCLSHSAHPSRNKQQAVHCSVSKGNDKGPNILSACNQPCQSIAQGLLSRPSWHFSLTQSLSRSLTAEKQTSLVKWWEVRGDETAVWDGGLSAFGAHSPLSGIVSSFSPSIPFEPSIPFGMLGCLGCLR